MSIFRENDVRGIYPDELDKAVAYRIGRAFVKYTGANKIAIGRDGRLSSDDLFHAIFQGIATEKGIVVDIGLCSTDMFCCMVNKYGFDAGIMITASHNPPRYNGFKFARKKAMSLVHTEVKKLEEVFLSVDCLGYDENKRVETQRIGSYREFAEYLIEKGDISGQDINNISVIVDAGNGVGGLSYRAIFEYLNKNSERVHYFPMYFDVDGNFPNHEANPMKEENLRDLRNMIEVLNMSLPMKNRKKFFGIATDSDADRAAFLDENGEFVYGDMVFALIARDYLKKNPKKRVGCDVRTSVAVIEDIKRNSGKVEITPAGYSFVKDVMRKDGIEIAAEVSNHYQFCLAEGFYLDSGILASLRLFEVMSREGKSLIELVKPLQRYPRTREINFGLQEKDTLEILERLKRKYSKNILHDIDGITIARGLDYDKSPIERRWWWANVRKSKTELMLRFNIEAEDERVLREVRKELEGFLGLTGGEIF